MLGNLNKRFLSYFNKNSGRSQRYTAFTLAEVLITLAIIGIVAAMTIPTLMQNTQNKELISMWKKDYSSFSQAYEQIVQDNGGTFVDVCSDMNCIRDKFSKYLSYSKLCDTLTTNGTNQCFLNSDNEVKEFGGNSLNWHWDVSGLILNNGGLVIFGDASDEPAEKSCSSAIFSSNIKNCGWIIVDVNGFKKPNTIGKDIFHLWLTPTVTLPVGAKDQDNTSATAYNSESCNNSNKDAIGWGCSAKYIGE